jgi:hypothetical protein
MNLYELSSNYAQLVELVENDEIELDMIADTLESIEDSIEVKVENIAKLIKNLEGEIEVFKKEEERLSSRRKTKENKVKWLKNYLLTSLELTKKDKIQAGTFTVRKQKNPPSIVIKDKSKIPEKFLIPQEPKEDKKAILEALKNGEQVDGVELAETTYHVRIH